MPNYRFTTHTATLPHSRGHAARRRRSRRTHFYRESFIDELAHAAGKDPYHYRRELIARTDLPYKADMLKALDMAAEMSGWGTPLPQGTVRTIGLEERGAEAGGHATLSAQVNTISISRQGEVRVLRVDIAHDEGFALVNPLTVRKQIEGQVTWFYNDVMYQECNVTDGRIVENNFDTFPLSRINEDPPEINITFFKTEHWLRRHGARPRHHAPIRHRRCRLPGHREALSRPALAQSRPDLELSRFNRKSAQAPAALQPGSLRDFNMLQDADHSHPLMKSLVP